MTFDAIKNKGLTLLQWIFICVVVGFFSGSASAIFLLALEKVTQIRTANFWIIVFLPVGGFAIGMLYHYYGKSVVAGNNLILEEYDTPRKTIPFRMAPLVLITTLLTHLFGGSAGREGTAVQMGAAISDGMQRWFKWAVIDRNTMLVLGISAGFASVFGTPVAGALFAMEIMSFKKITFKTVLLSFAVAFIAHYTVELWPVTHTHYTIPIVPDFSLAAVFWIVFVSILFGLAALLFSRSTHFWGDLFRKTIAYAPIRPLVGGCVLALVLFNFSVQPYIGLGVPVIVDAFSTVNPWYAFLLKILFTGFTLGAGFKGGEVTPLFFVGATLGSALSIIVPMPIALLAGMGFVAVFSGATHTPIACSLMGMELFGLESGFYITLACIVAYFCSGAVGIYKSQIVKGPKGILYASIRRQLRFSENTK